MKRALTAAMLIVCALQAQEAFQAIPPDQAAQYRLNFAKVFFADPEAERADRAALESQLSALEELKGAVASSANLERALALQDRVLVLLNRHYSYLYLRHAVDTTNEKSLHESSDLDAEVNRRTAFVRRELMNVDERKWKAFVAARPSLQASHFAMETVRRYRDHTLSLQEEELLNVLAPDTEWPADLYQKLRTGKPDRDMSAFALIGLARARTRRAQLRHFPDAASEVYFDSYWTREDVERLIATIEPHLDLYRRYLKLRADHGVVSAAAAPRFTIAEASAAIRSAVAPFGAEYASEVAALLDPANGRMDIVPGPNRRTGGFSQGFIGTDSVFFAAGFTGTYNDVRVLAHESTHALQRQLMNRHGVRPIYARGPSYLSEAFAIFTEFLLPDALREQATDPLRQRYFLEQFLIGKGTQMFAVAPEVVVEHAVYDGVTTGTISGADDLDAISKRAYAPYILQPERDETLKSRWMNIRLMYEDPFYDTNYVTGSVLGLNLYDLYRRDPKFFVPNYVALLRNGFDAPPDVLLKKFLSIDLRDPVLVTNALRIVEQQINLLEASYGR